MNKRRQRWERGCAINTRCGLNEVRRRSLLQVTCVMATSCEEHEQTPSLRPERLNDCTATPKRRNNTIHTASCSPAPNKCAASSITHVRTRGREHESHNLLQLVRVEETTMGTKSTPSYTFCPRIFIHRYTPYTYTCTSMYKHTRRTQHIWCNKKAVSQ